MTYTFETATYRVIMTELRGLFVVDFTWVNGMDEITIKKSNFISLPKLLAEKGYRMPFDANFQAVTVANSFYDRQTGLENQTIIVTTGRFHTFQFFLLTDKNGNVQSVTLTRVYLRYAFYEVSNFVKHFDDFLAVTQTIPDEFAWSSSYTRQILTIYHTAGNFTGTVENRSLIGAYVLE